MIDPIDRKAKGNQAPCMMVVYRQEGDRTIYQVVRNGYVPLTFAGCRCGDLELAYAV